jgi:hypothetical protein
VLIALLASALPLLGGAPPAPSADSLRAEADRVFGELRDGHVDRAHGRLAEALRRHVTARDFAAGMEPTAQRFGAFVRIERAEAGQGSRIGSQPVAVLEAVFRFARGAAPVTLTFVEEGGAWKLRGLVVHDPDHPMAPLDERLAIPAARAILDGAVREGLGSIAARFPPEARDAPEEAMRATLDGQHRLLGPLRSFTLGTPSMNSVKCRDVVAPARFEHGNADVSLTFCPQDGAWRLFEIEVIPDLAPPLFERLVALAVSADGTRTGVSARCPPARVPVGGAARCRVTVTGKTHEVTVRHVKQGSIEVTGLP